MGRLAVTVAGLARPNGSVFARLTRHGSAAGPMRRRVARVLLGLAGIVLLVVAQNLAAHAINEVVLRLPGIDKVAHAVLYAGVVCAVYALVGFVHQGRLVLAAATAFTIGLIDESAQILVAARSFEIADLAVNACGVALGAAIWPLRRARGTAAAVALIAVAITGSLAVGSHWQLRHYNRGLLLERRGEFALALEQYHLALGDGLESPGLFNGLGWVEIESGVGSPTRAVTYAARALEMRPQDPDIQDTYGWALHHAGRTQEALGVLLAAYDASPRMYCIHYHLGEVYAALGDGRRARAHFEQQIALLPGEREARRAEAALRRLAGTAGAAPGIAAPHRAAH